MRVRIPLACLLVALLAGCNLTGTAPAAQPQASFPTSAETGTPLPPAEPKPSPHPPELSAEVLQNSGYDSPQYQKRIKLAGGKFQGGSGADSFIAQLLDPIAFGDLNGDGIQDAAVLLAESGGGTGNFVSVLALLNRDGKPFQAGARLVDDRPVIHSLRIADGRIRLEALIHGPSDPMAAPSLEVVETYRLGEGALLLTGLASNNAGGAARSIQIDSPKDGTEVSGNVRVKGSMPVGPFENTLSYRVYDLAGNLLAQGAFMVQAPDMGAPATFDNSVNLSALRLPSRVSFQLWDVSMADGSPIAIDSVFLSIQ